MDARYLASFAAMLCTGLVAAAAAVPSDRDLRIHEWGTFTSVASADGSAMQWQPLAGPPELPCFVSRFTAVPKSSLVGFLRMETPVIYFYAPHTLTANVRVRFPHGLITEWYPHADVTPAQPGTLDSNAAIEWTNIAVTPGASASFQVGAGTSRYYAARHTDAAPLQTGNDRERFLFYRGVGESRPRLSARVSADGSVLVRNLSRASVPAAILVESRAGRVTYRIARDLRDRIVFAAPVDGDVATLRETLAGILVDAGLYPKEAAAMLETWRDSWLEEGSRVFYILPVDDVNAVLPIDVSPVPAKIARVFVGRMELVTPATERAVASAIAAGDRGTLDKYGRFLEPIVQRILDHMGAGADRSRIEAFEQTLSGTYARLDTGCR